MNIYVIGSVRHAKANEEDKIAAHVIGLEKEGHKVYYPRRDAPQQDRTGYNIVFSELAALKKTNRVDVLWNPDSEGSHVDLGMAFSLVSLASINLVDDPANSFLLNDHYWQGSLEMMTNYVALSERENRVFEFEWLTDWKTQSPMQERIEQRLLLGILFTNLSREKGLKIHADIRGHVNPVQKSYAKVITEIERRQKRGEPLF